MSAALKATAISKSFGGLKAVQRVSIEAHAGRILSIIGPNGAGKTTFFNCLSGIYPLDGGTVELGGKRIDGLAPHLVSRAGLSRSFQNIRLFPEMAALQNVLVGRFSRSPRQILASILRTKAWREQEDQAVLRSRQLLDFVGLSDRAGSWARALPYGLQRRLEVARALATDPNVLLLDEPGAGMNPQEIVEMMALVKSIAESGIAVKPLSNYYLQQPLRRGLLVGYAYVYMEKITYYGKLLAHVIQAGTGTYGA